MKTLILARFALSKYFDIGDFISASEASVCHFHRFGNGVRFDDM